MRTLSSRRHLPAAISDPAPPLVTVVIPARNEAHDLGRCLDAVAAQAWPAGSLEVVVVDGESDDDTVGTAERLLRDRPFARVEVVRNPGRITPSNLNLGLALARGEYVCRVDARSIIPPDYVRTCVDVLATRPEVVVVGGAQIAVAPDGGAVGAGIERALNNRYAMGLSRYRRGAASGPSDTVYLGFFRTSDLRRVRGWNERFGTNQDFELNRRLGEDGVVWFESSLPVGYIPRESLGDLFRQYERFGSWKVRYWRLTGDRPRPRQVAALAALPVASTLAVGLLAHPSTRRAAVVGAAAGAVALDALGNPSPAPWRVRGTALAAVAAVTAGWSFGAWRALAASLVAR